MKDSLLQKFRGNADAVVTYPELPIAFFFLGVNVDAEWLLPPVLDGIAHEVLEELDELDAVGGHCWQLIDSHFSPTFRDFGLQVAERLLERFPGIRALECPPASAHPGKGKDVVDEPGIFSAPSTA